MAALFQQWVNKNIWDFSTKGVNLENPKTVINGWALDQVLGGGNHNVSTPDGALTISAVYRAVAIKSGLISSLPFQVFKKTTSGRVQVNNIASDLLSKKPNPKMSKAIYFDRGMQHYDLLGNHFALIKRNGLGVAIQLDLLHQNKDKVEVIESANAINYKVKGVEGFISSDDMIHVPNMGDSLMGKSVIQYMREDAELMSYVREYAESFFGRGGKPAGLVIPKMNVTTAQRAEMKKSFQEAKEQGGDVAMPYGWEYKEVSVPPEEASWVATNAFSISTIARWFGVPTQKLGDSAVKYSNVEFMGIEFLQDTINPIATKFENEYTNKLFQLPNEKDLYSELNLDAYLRADSITKAEMFSKYVQNGIKKPNEIRKYNNDPEDEFGNDLMMQSGTMPLRLIEKQMAMKAPTPTGKSIKARIERQVKEGLSPQLIIEGLFSNDGQS